MDGDKTSKLKGNAADLSDTAEEHGVDISCIHASPTGDHGVVILRSENLAKGRKKPSDCAVGSIDTSLEELALDESETKSYCITKKALLDTENSKPNIVTVSSTISTNETIVEGYPSKDDSITPTKSSSLPVLYTREETREPTGGEGPSVALERLKHDEGKITVKIAETGA